MQNITLNNGVAMPQLGYGVFQVSPDECERCVRDAIEVGYRSIDTAQAYFNEEGVGRAIASCGVQREELFITTKVWISRAGEARATASIEESLRKLGGDYIDLLLIHQPFGDYYGTYRAMEAALATGKVRAIGVSNFAPDRLADLCAFNEVKPAINQVELHPFCQQVLARKHMDALGIAVQSWGPFAEGKKDLFTHPVLTAIAARHERSVAQIVLRYLLQLGIVLIPKSAHRERMKQNMAIFDFSLPAEDCQLIAALDEKESAFLDHRDPATIDFLAQYQV